MKDNHSRPESKYIERWITPLVSQAIKNYPVVVLTGARQVGKSTFLCNAPHLQKWEYVTFDNFDVLDAAKESPLDFLAGKDQLIIDEVQKGPGILSSIKQEVDNLSGRKHFLLSGSANLLLMQKVSESVAGRAVYYPMHPLTIGEIRNRKPTEVLDSLLAGIPLKDKTTIMVKEKIENLVIRGFLPPAVVQFNTLSAVMGWIEGYVSTFLERDLRQFAQIENLPDFRRLMGTLALRSGQVANQSEISRDANVTQPTAHRYINLLEISFLIERLPAYAVNRTKRLIKSPKIYWSDCGLASFLMGHHYPNEIKKSREWGALFETLVYQHLKVWASLKVPAPKVFYWRTSGGQEVDFVVEAGDKLLAIEVKASSRVQYSDAASLKLFFEEYPEARAGIIVYGGKDLKRMGEKIWAVPWELIV